MNTNKPKLQASVTAEQLQEALDYYQSHGQHIRSRVQLLSDDAALFYGAVLMQQEHDTPGTRAWLVYRYEKYTEAQS